METGGGPVLVGSPGGVYRRPQTERSGARTLAAIMSAIRFATEAHFQLIERKRPQASGQKYDANQREFIQIAAVPINLPKQTFKVRIKRKFLLRNAPHDMFQVSPVKSLAVVTSLKAFGTFFTPNFPGVQQISNRARTIRPPSSDGGHQRMLHPTPLHSQ